MTSVTADAWIEAHPEVESLRVAVCDLNGALRGKRIPVSQLDKALEGGLRMPLSITGVDVWGEDIVGGKLVFETGDADGLCQWTGRGPLPLSWTTKPSALVPLWLTHEDGQPFLGDPRQALAAVQQRFSALGLTPVAASELEFYLVDATEEIPKAPTSPVSGRILDTDAVLSLRELDHFDHFLDDVYAACEEQGVPADAAIAENGPGQFEINLVHVADALEAADHAVLFKEIVRSVARKHGFSATFMAKPYGDRAGSGYHIHFSLLDREGRNVFDDGGELGSDTLRHAIAGLMAAMADSTLIFAPHFNSYRRLRPGSHAPSAVAWGYENRTVAIRVPGGAPQARRIEHRVAGADANPYLVLAAILGAALYGIEQKLEAPEPIAGDAYSLDLPGIPPDWASAVEAFQRSKLIPELLSPRLQRMLVDCKRQEMAVFAERVTDFEYYSYLEAV